MGDNLSATGFTAGIALTLNDITGWCLIYQGVFVSGVNPGGIR